MRKSRDSGDVGTRTEDGTLCILLWNYYDVAGGFAEPTEVTLRVEGIGTEHDAEATTVTRVDEFNANAFTAWRNLGEPQDPSPAQIASLHETATLIAHWHRLPVPATRSTIA